jgi:hypothetical protein
MAITAVVQAGDRNDPVTKSLYCMYNAATGSPFTYGTVPDTYGKLGNAGTPNYNIVILGDASYTQPAFQIYTVLYTYQDFAQQTLGANLTDKLAVAFPAENFSDPNFQQTAYDSASKTIFLRKDSVFPPGRANADVIGHEFGHYVADEAGFLTRMGETHWPGYNLRFPAAGVQPLTMANEQAAFNEGWADCFAVAAKNGEPVGPLNPMSEKIGKGPSDKYKLYAFYNSGRDKANFDAGRDTANFDLSDPLGTPGQGQGEDDELSVARILFAMAVARPGDYGLGLGYRAVFDILRGATPPGAPAVTTLYGLWQATFPTAPGSLATQEQYGNLYQADGASPVPVSAGPTAGAPLQFVFNVPLLLGPALGNVANDSRQAFSTVTIYVLNQQGEMRGRSNCRW